MRPEGAFTALVTPFAGGQVDLPKVRDLVDFQVRHGIAGLCPTATTGEGSVLSREEKAAVIRAVVETAAGRALVFPGTGTYDTRESIELTRMARDLGADGALVVTPYYNKPPQEGLFRHFEAIATAVPFPIILYNVPARTSVSLAPSTTARLSKIPNIVALKDASGRVEEVTQVRTLCDLAVLSGEDALTYSILGLGGTGVISVAANLIPRAVADLCGAARRGDGAGALDLHQRCFDLFKDLFLETNPIPVKTAMRQLGRLNGELRAPLCEMSALAAEKLGRTLKACPFL